MLSINHLNIQFGEKHLFRDVSVRVHPNDRIGLVGVNGAGKSTLLKIMAGITATDAGVLVQGKQTTVGYLPQEITSAPEGRTLYEEAKTAFDHLLKVQDEIQEISNRLAELPNESPEFTKLVEKQGHLQHTLDHSDFYRMQSQIEKVLFGLGFKQVDLTKDCTSFSGGWLMRLMLAKLLLTRPTLILLDEPTNHLDLDSLTWLEDFLRTYEGAMIIISHDRMFLDNVTTSTWELSLGNLTVYKGNYTKYLVEKEERMQIQRASYDNQQAKIQQTMRFVERFRAKSTKAKQVQSRLKQLEKMDLIELEDTERQISFRFPPAPPSGRSAIEVNNLRKSFGAHTVFHDITFSLQRGDKMAVVGVNGAGKSTLVRLLAGLLEPDSGNIRPGHNVVLSYFGQHQARELAPQYTVLQTLSHTENDMTLTQQRSLLGTFLFQGDDVDKKVMVLSGGEKSRLALAKMIATPANLMIMDEPTNHLDMTSQEVLQEALSQYDGSIIVVSHNRYFLNTFVNKVLEIKEGVATLYEGNIDDYLAKVHNEAESKETASSRAIDKTAKQAAFTPKAKSKELKQLQARLRQEKSVKLKPFQKSINKIEKDIEQLESRKKELEQLLADPELYKDQDAFGKYSKEYKDTERRLERNYYNWEEQQKEKEKIENEYDAKINAETA